MENIKVGFKALEGMKLIDVIELEKKVIKFNTQRNLGGEINKMETKQKKKMNELLSILAESQETTAPIKLSIGYVSEDNQVQHNCIVIEECPGMTLDILNSHEEFSMCMVKGGLLVEVY